ncbi:MAG: DNA-formamidopyrimidine glycosylase family protein [Bdellovibrionota bacterium]|nr:DNA-formamidopyrimidine glycosylase family protein [Bdellovibrionota bacterium]
MPELPEVETVRKGLLDFLPLKINKVERTPELASILKTEEFPLKGLTISSLERKGKVLIFHLGDGKTVVSRFGMAGSWEVSEEKNTKKHNHLQLHCTSSQGKVFLSYVDARRFGKMHIGYQEVTKRELAKVGVDVTTEEFNEQALRDISKKYPDRQIKPLLLEQEKLAGIGNYLACEILAHCNVRPTRRCKTITKEETKKMVWATKKVVSESIEKNGLTFTKTTGYRDVLGNAGEFFDGLVVFRQKLCKLCGDEPVKKIVLATRGTFYCPQCQK